jgi:hypothetical protein
MDTVSKCVLLLKTFLAYLIFVGNIGGGLGKGAILTMWSRPGATLKWSPTSHVKLGCKCSNALAYYSEKKFYEICLRSSKMKKEGSKRRKKMFFFEKF